MVQSSSTPRLLMNRLRQIMAEGGTARDRLDSVVRAIATTLVADVCSIYLRTSDDGLELVATEGLRPEAVSTTRLRFDEGLVGQIAVTARPLSIQDAPRHPAFSYRPETGEDPFHAFMGVPILRNGRVTGVLTVQNRTERVYGEDEVESLETIAMVLAEFVAAEFQPNEAGASAVSVSDSRPSRTSGRILCEGLGTGLAVFHDPVVPAAKFFAQDSAGETKRLDAALGALRDQIDRMIASEGSGGLWGDPRDVMEAYRMLANDPSWAERLSDGVRSGLTAEAAIDRARREHRARFESARDPFLRERLHDLEDLDNRLLRILAGAEVSSQIEKARGAVLVARRLGPAELLEYRSAGLAAVLLEEAAVSSHAAIVAKALDIPTLGGLPNITTSLEEGDAVIVDAEEGVAHLRPDDELVAAYGDRSTLRSQREARFRELRDKPAATRDGERISLMLNAGLSLDLEHIDEAGADGIGLFRTEFQFLVSERLPRLGEQVDLYTRVFEAAQDRPVLFRTLDLGGDKILPSLNRSREENPALGWRSIRFALDKKGLFRRQLRALARAGADRRLSVMFPMVTVASEFLEAKQMLLEEVEWSTSRGHAPPAKLEIGAMLESPSLAYELPALAEAADFISVGTNDLMQFFHAADRLTPKVADRYDLISRSAMSFLGQIARSCRELGLPVSICGESAGRPLEALALICVGFRRLSMPAGGVGPVKEMVRSVDLAGFRPDFQSLLEKSYGSFRNDLLALARDHGVAIGGA